MTHAHTKHNHCKHNDCDNGGNDKKRQIWTNDNGNVPIGMNSSRVRNNNTYILAYLLRITRSGRRCITNAYIQPGALGILKWSHTCVVCIVCRWLLFWQY